MLKFLRSALAPLCIIIWLFAYFIAYLPPSFTAKAENSTPQRGTYACILNDNAFFYATPDEKDGLFLLPPTYYVRLLDYTHTLCRVEYQTEDVHTRRLIGYVKTEHLVFVPYVPRRPYLQYLFDVTYRVEDSKQTSDGFLTEITMSCAYYGDYEIGSEIYCYVLREGEFGYVPKPAELRYEENTEYADYLEALKNNPSGGNGGTKTKDNTPAQIAILVVLCLLVPLLAALILKPKRDPYPPSEFD